MSLAVLKAARWPAWKRRKSRSKFIWRTACLPSRSSVCPKPRSRNRRTACAPRCKMRASNSPRGASPSIWRRPICRRNRAASICRSRSASWPLPGRCRRPRSATMNSPANCRCPENCARSAARWPGILPAMTDEEARVSAAVQSLTSGFSSARWKVRPYRAPHHTASGVALVGGGGSPRPGEISLAHRGVLFLDELQEFDRKVLEVQLEPLESGQITISRAARQADFPARFQLLAAMTPCPSGYLGHPSNTCRCTPDNVARYQSRISGPLLDRIDMQIQVAALPQEEMLRQADGEPSAAIAQREQQAFE